MKKRGLKRGKRFGLGMVAVDFAVAIFLLLAAAMLMERGILPEGKGELCVSGIRMVSIFLIGISAFRSTDIKNPLIYILVPIVFFFTLLLGNLLVVGGKLQNVGSGCVTIVLGVLAAIFWDLKTKSRKVPGKKRF